MREIEHTILTAAYQEWQAAPNGAKSYIVAKNAAILGVAYQTLHRKFKLVGFNLPQKKAKATKGVSVIPGLHDMAKTIAHLYALIPRRAGRKPPLGYTIQKAIINGLIPELAKDIAVGTFARVLREQKLLDREGRVLRFEAKTPMEQVQYDVSGSEYLYVARFEGGEPVLRVRSSKSYKNKDKYENYRLWYHGMVDDCSRYWLAMPFVSPGESSLDATKFCKWAFSKKSDERMIFRGLPSRIYMDNGPLSRADATKNLMERLGVEIKTHEPESSSDTGKIEVKWKPLWATFEAGEFLMDPNWKNREYRLPEIHERLMNYTISMNHKQHPNRKASKEDVWRTVLLTGGVVDIEESAFDTTFNRYRRLVGRDGIVRLDNDKYFVKGLYDTWVYVYQGLFGGQMVAEDIVSHQRYEVIPFVMPGLDEHKADKKLECVKVREEAQEIKQQLREAGNFKGVYEGVGANCIRPQAANVKQIPVRAKEVRKVENPFDLTVYSSITAAMTEFCEIVGTFISKTEKEEIEELIKENGLKKDFVKDLAFEIRAEIESRRMVM